MKYYQHHIGDYRKDTAHLSLLEHGIYRQLLDLYYDREGHIEYDLKRISRLISARTKKERDLLKNVVEDFFVEKNGFLFQRRCEKEIAQLYDKSEKARRSAFARWGKDKDANAMRTHSGCNARDDANDMLPINPLTQLPINPTTHKPINPINKQTKIKPKPLSNTSAKPAADIDHVFTHWKRVMNHPRAKLDQKRTMLIQKALATGYSVDDLMTAITGCSRTPHNMGDNDRGERYDGLHIIFRSADQIDRFIGNTERPVIPVTKNKSAIMESAKAAKNIIGISQGRLT